MSLKNNKQNWEDASQIDPLWAILSDPNKKYLKWDIDEFFAIGENEIKDLMVFCEKLGYPKKRKNVLDFGCGIGRLTRPLSNYFQKCYGLDISENMIKLAKKHNKHCNKCEFILNNEDNLQLFPDDYFDMIYSDIVLQHIDDKKLIKAYISEFIRILKYRGLLVFQLPSYIPIKHRFQIRRRTYSYLRFLGISKDILYFKLGLHPILMNFIPTKEVISFIKKNNAKILKIDTFEHTSYINNIYFITKL
ncbi:MAG: hypothetical protein CIT01_00115 [Methanobacterium sp. BRmetb2]|nr:MAG: hypothetical protein CIT01_00115 [Methanobacterium sp. BRmetb2]